MLRILVFGAGPLGSYYTAKLHEAGFDVSILARGQRYHDIKEYGIVLERFDTQERAVHRVPAVQELRASDAYDLVLVVMGKNYVPAILPALSSNRATPTILFLGNNVAGPDELVRTLGLERILLGFPGLSGARDRHVVRYITGKEPSVTMGELDGTLSERITELKGAFEKAGFRVKLCSNMDAWLKCHGALIVPLSGAYIKAGRDVTKLAGDKETIALMLKAMKEGFRALRALGFPVLPSELKYIERLPLWILTPLAQSLLNNKDMKYTFAHGDAMRNELRLLNQELTEVVRRSNVPTPAYDELTQYLGRMDSTVLA